MRAAANDADVDLGGPADAGGGDAAPSKDGGPGAGDRDGRGASGGPGPALCPETDIDSPRLPNTVVVDDDLLGADATWTADKIYVVTRDLGVKGHKRVAEGSAIRFTSGASFNGALMISPKRGDYEGPTLSNLLVAHSAASGIVSAASAANPAPPIQMKTRYEAAALNIEIEDTARSALGANGVCR